jgi:fructose-1,6-bisphosphatase/inositol monophosphatase family enzyme
MTGHPSLLDVENRVLSQRVDNGGTGQDKRKKSERDWPSFCLRLVFDALCELRRIRFSDFAGKISIKKDGSPVSSIEERVESFLRRRITEFDPTASVVGEEHGGEIARTGISLAIDPIDGTWSFLNRAETFATTLALYREGVAEQAFIANAATGEIAYAARRDRARLLQIGLAGEPSRGYDLPLPTSSTPGLLVNLHPCRQMGPIIEKLVADWGAGRVQFVKATGGSPVWSMLDAAKGTCTYVNLWLGKPSDPFDLAAGLLLVRAAGGDVIDLSGSAVSAIGHSGPFIAGTNKTHLLKAAEIIRGIVTIDD